MNTAVGIDLSLTSTGLARVSDAGDVTTTLATSTGKTKDTLLQRFIRQTKLTDAVLDFVKEGGLPDVVIIEGLFAAGQVGGMQLDRFGLWWRVVGSLLIWEVPVYVVTASQGKKFLAGSGKADKGSMVRAAGKLWPDWEPSTPHSSEDEADAIAMASVGLALTARAPGVGGVPFTITDYRKEVLDKLRKANEL